jgi:hypothetical protein
MLSAVSKNRYTVYAADMAVGRIAEFLDWHYLIVAHSLNISVVGRTVAKDKEATLGVQLN